MYADVSAVERLSPSLLRLEFSGGTLDEFEGSAATDAYIKARFLPADSPLTVPFDDAEVDGTVAEHRPRPRRYTIRRWDPARRVMTIDFVVHGDEGYAGPWAQRAVPGDRLQFTGPGGSYRPDPQADWHLLVGDESAFGAIGASLEALPPASRALAFVVVDSPAHQIEFPTAADVTVTWLYRDSSPAPDDLLRDAVAAAAFPDGRFDVFVHGEAGEVRAVRKHLIADRGVDPDGASISPYWRRRHTDEDWRAVKRQWIAEQAADV